MPSAKQHIQVRFPDQQMAVLRRLAKLQGVSMASIVNDLIDAAMPTFEKVVVFAENAQRLSSEAKETAAAKIQAAADVVLPKLGDAMKQGDIFLGEVARITAETQGKRPATTSVSKARRGSSRGTRRKAVKRARGK